jgi:hypothetical protein
MSSTKHAPGPWTRDRWGSVVDADGNIVVFAPSSFSLGSVTDHPEREANVELAIAAPELLEALTLLLPGAEAMGWNTDKARAAIVKATGGSTS